MRQARGLLPYAAFAVLIVGATVVALVLTTLGLPPAPAATAAPSPAASSTAVVRPATTDLSPSGRLAYWRTEANGDFLLWLANADNSRNRRLDSRSLRFRRDRGRPVRLRPLLVERGEIARRRRLRRATRHLHSHEQTEREHPCEQQ